MQFYTLNTNPEISAKLLPDYALKKVNIREGYQILCDIGHITNVEWPNQNKEYNPYHALTRRFWESRGAFDFFMAHYQEYLIEYINRFEKETFWHERFIIIFNIKEEIRKKINDLPYYSDHFKGKCFQDAQYLFLRKQKFLSLEEIKKMNKLFKK